VVYEGTYEGGINFGGRKDIRLASANPGNIEIVRNTIIDCQGSSRAFTFKHSEGPDTVLDGFTIVNGNSSLEGGGAIYIGDNSSPTIAHLIINDCSANNGGGGAIYIGANSNPTIGDVTIDDCSVSAGDGGAIYVGSYSSPIFSDVIISHCSVSGGDGGGIFADIGSTPIFTNCSVTGCSATGGFAAGGYGGAAYCDTGSSPEFTDCQFSDNSANSGGGFYYSNASVSMLTRCTFSNNTANHSGGAICYDFGCVSNLDECLFEDNTAVEYGGGIFYDVDSSVTVADSNFTGNSAAFGGALYFDPDSAGTVVDTVLVNNIADGPGGAIFVDTDCNIAIADCNISYNQGGQGGGLYCYDSPLTTITGCEIKYNEAVGSLSVWTLYFEPDPNDANVPLTPDNPLDTSDPSFDPNDPNLIVEHHEGFIGIARGGGISSWIGTSLIADCEISYNSARTSGGGVYLAGDEYLDIPYEVELTNCLINNNKATSGGGGVSCDWWAEVMISNCTIADNVLSGKPSYGGGLYCSHESNAEVIDSIIWGNSGSTGSQVAVGSGDEYTAWPSTIKITYSAIQVFQESPDPNEEDVPQIVDASLVGPNTPDYFRYWQLETDDYNTSGSYGVDGWVDDEGTERVVFFGGDTASILTVSIPAGDNPHSHPLNPYAPGEIAERTFVLERTFDLEESPGHGNELYVDAENNVIYLGADVYGIRKYVFDSDVNNPVAGGPAGNYVYDSTIAPATPSEAAWTQSLAYDPDNDVWYAGSISWGETERQVWSYDGSQGENGVWVVAFTYEGGSHHDGMEYVNGYLYLADYQGDYIKTFTTDGTLVDVYYHEPLGHELEGMGFDALGHFWVGSHGNTVSEFGGGILQLRIGGEVPPSPPIYIGQDCTLIGWDPNDPNDFWSWDANAWDPSLHNIDDDPCFTHGYYLSQIKAGQDINSPCVDAGDPNTALYPSKYTTRTDGYSDVDVIDMGYHYDHGVAQYELTVNVVGGHGTVDLTSGTYNEGDVVTINAMADPNYYVRGWWDDANGTLLSIKDTLEVVMNSDRDITVQFRWPDTIIVEGGGDALKEAVEDAENGDLLLVRAETYDGDIDLQGKQLKLVSMRPDDPNYIAATIIDGGGSDRAFTFNNGEGTGTLIDGFTLVNCGVNAHGGGAIFIGPDASPVLVNLVITDCNASNSRGGAIYISSGASPVLGNITISNCSAAIGGGAIYVGAGNSSVIEDCTITDCSVLGGYGGAIYYGYDCNAVLRRCEFSDNSAGSGGALAFSAGCISSVESCIFINNTSDYGGAIYFDADCFSDVNECVFEDNAAEQYGGGIFYDAESDLNITDSNFTGNSAVSGGALYFDPNSAGTVLDTIMVKNIAEETGGAVYIIESGDLSIIDCNISRNTAIYGGAIYSEYSPAASIIGCEIRHNDASGTVITYEYSIPDPNWQPDPTDPNAVAPMIPISPDDPNFDLNDPNLVTEDLIDESAISAGGGIYSLAGPLLIADSDISFNVGGTSGGAIYLVGYGDLESPVGPHLRNNLITNNEARTDGAGVSCNWNTHATITNCTIADNRLTGLLSFGGGLYCSYSSTADVKDTIIWGNFGLNGSQVAVGSGDAFWPWPSNVTITRSSVDLRVAEELVAVDPDSRPVIREGFDSETLLANDDGSTGLVDIGFTINYYGTITNGLYVNNNGNVTFDAPMGTFTPFGLTGDIGTSIIAPFFADVDTRTGNEVTYGTGMIDGHLTFVVNWIEVGYYSTHVDKLNSFQLVMIDRSDRAPGDFDIEFNYGQLLWETGDASGGQDGFGGMPVHVGFSNGTGYPGTFIELAGSGLTLSFLDGSPDGLVHGNRDSNVNGRYIFQVKSGQIGLSAGDPIYVEDECTLDGWNADSNSWDANNHNGEDDPCFVAGYYLSQIDSGQPVDSNYVDAGSDFAVNVGMDNYTTRTTGVGDDGVVDIGYHYRQGAAMHELNITVEQDANDPGVHGIVDPNSGWYYEGAVLTLTAMPDPNYYVMGWYDEDGTRVSIKRTLEVVMDSNQAYTVVFRRGDVIPVSGGGAAIQRAIDAAENGDVIVAAAETYEGNINLRGKEIKLYGINPDDANVIARTIIDCHGENRAFTFENGENEYTLIDGFKIINGSITEGKGGAIYVGEGTSPLIGNIQIVGCKVENGEGGAIFVDSESSPTFYNVDITNCYITDSVGGAIYVGFDSSPVFIDCTVAYCSAVRGSGGAVYCAFGSSTTFTNCTFTDNSATFGGDRMGAGVFSAGGDGGAIYYAFNCASQLNGCKFTRNEADFSGGGIFYNSENTVTISGCSFTDNIAGEYGAGIYFSHDASGTIEETTLTGNEAGLNGGGIFMTDANLAITACDISYGSATNGAGIYCVSSPLSSITNCDITYNDASGIFTYVEYFNPDPNDPNAPVDPNNPNGDPNDPNVVVIQRTDTSAVAEGGGIYSWAGPMLIIDTRINHNYARTSGGGLYLAGDHDSLSDIGPVLRNCLVTSNTAGRDGGGVSCNWMIEATIIHTTISDNKLTQVPSYGGGLYCSYRCDVKVKDSIIWGNSANDGSQLAVGSGEVFGWMLSSTLELSHTDVGPSYDPNDAVDFSVPQQPSGGSGGPSSVLVDAQTIYDQFDSGDATVKVMVSLAEPAQTRAATDWDSADSVAVLRAEIANRQSSVLSTLSSSEFTLRHRFENQAGFSGEVTTAGLNKLLSNSLVAHVEPVRKLKKMLAQSIPLASAMEVRQTYNGADIAIAIVDTGVDYTHPMLGNGTFPNNKIIGGYDFADGDADPIPGGVTDGTAHGTACAGIAAGDLGNVGDYIGGVAYGAKIYALKATADDDDGFWDDDTLAAWDWCVTHRNDDPVNPIMIISNSWGMPDLPFDDAKDADIYAPAMTIAADTAVSAGITILAASGNDGFAGDGISWPSAMSDVISVGAVYDTTDQVTEYSNTADNLDILAPADPMYTTDIVGEPGYDAGDYNPTFAGTSSACPFAAGIVADLQAAALDKIGSYLSPNEVRHILITTGVPVTDTKVAITKPRVDLGSAILAMSYGPPIYIEEGCTLNGREPAGPEEFYIWDIIEWDPYSNNLNDDPCFVNIVEGPNFIPGYYLSHIATGQLTDSNCVDAGSDLAVTLGLDPNEYTTRIDGHGDAGTVDVGYHYLISNMPKLTVDIVDAWGNVVDANLANGYIDPNMGIYPKGAEVRLWAYPDFGYRVAAWTGIDNEASTEPNNIVTMTEDKHITVEFELTPIHQLGTTVIGGHGWLEPAGGPMFEGVIDLIAHPDEGYRVARWMATDDDTSTELTNTITLLYDTEIAVVFEEPRVIEVSGDANAIQDAIDQARDGDTLVVAPDTYNGNINLRGKAITVVCANPDDPNVIASTIIDAMGDGRGFIFNTAEDANTVVDGFMIINGSVAGENGGGVYVDSNSSPTIMNLIISGCTATYADPNGGGQGGGIYVARDTDPEFINCTVIDCSAESGGGAFCDVNSRPTFTHCTFIQNSAIEIGGGLLCDSNSLITIDDCNFTDNLSPYGAGLYGEPNSSMVVTGGAFVGNIADSDGGAAYWNGAYMYMTETEVLENAAERGAGLFFKDSPATSIVGCTFRLNSAPLDAVDPNDPNDPNALLVGEGGAMYCYATPALIRDCVMTYNIANTSGGAVYIAGRPCVPTLDNCLIVNNVAGRDGGGVSANWYAAPLVSNCTIVSNSAPGSFGEEGYTGFGGGFYSSYYSNSEIINSILWDNYALAGSELHVGSGFLVYDQKPSTITVSYSAVKGGKSAAQVDLGCTLDWGSGNTLADPLFVTGPLGNYYLSQTAAGQSQNSPCVDTGSDSANAFGLNEYTTRTNEGFDTLTVDMGYHYPLSTLMEPCRFCDPASDGIVNFKDYCVLALSWLDAGCSAGDDWCSGADFTFDTNVDNRDLRFLAECWLMQDTEAPVPNPSEWAVEPNGVSATSIRMTAVTTVDAWDWAIEYGFCNLTTDPDCDSVVWNSSPTYEQTGLTTGSEYCYTVKAREVRPGMPQDQWIETEWAPGRCAIPDPDLEPDDTTPPTPEPYIETIYPNSPNSITMFASTITTDYTLPVEYYFENMTVSGHDSGWQLETTYTDGNLEPETTYCYRVRARDSVPEIPDDGTGEPGNKTNWSDSECETTPEEPDMTKPFPDPAQWDPAVDANGFSGEPHQINIGGGTFDYWAVMKALDATDDSGVEYKFFCSTENDYNSGGSGDPGGPEWRNVDNVPLGEDPSVYKVLLGPKSYSASFYVIVRDRSPNHNDTGPSPVLPWN